MPAYVIYDVEISDPEPNGNFMRQMKPIIAAGRLR